jgi:hypothetical protein
VAAAATISSGVSILYYLYEVAEAIDLRNVERLLKAEPSQPRKTPSYIQFQNPPLVAAGDAMRWRGRAYECRVKFYDYGVVSATLRAPFSGSWADLIALSNEVMSNSELEAAVGAAIERRLDSIRPALIKPFTHRMTEDYAIFGVYQEHRRLSGLDLVAQHGPEIAQVLRGESARLSTQETAEAMSNPMSYYPDDLLITSWNGAFIFDDPEGLEATAEILEYANSQLLEYRYYDNLLSQELSAVYDEMERVRSALALFRSYRYRRTARRLNALFLDISELTEKSDNSLKFFGDLFASRVYRHAAQRLGLPEWRMLLDRKLQSAAATYHSLIDEVSAFRMEFMEAAILVLILLELVLSLFHITA